MIAVCYMGCAGTRTFCRRSSSASRRTALRRILGNAVPGTYADRLRRVAGNVWDPFGAYPGNGQFRSLEDENRRPVNADGAVCYPYVGHRSFDGGKEGCADRSIFWRASRPKHLAPSASAADALLLAHELPTEAEGHRARLKRRADPV